MRPKLAIEVMKAGIKDNTPQLWVSKPGIGKSEILTQAAANLNADLYIAHPPVLDPTYFQGQPAIVTTEDGRRVAEHLPYGQMRKLMEYPWDYDKPVVLLLDDVGQAPDSVQAATMQLTLARELNGQKLPPCVRIMAATNDRHHRAAVRGIIAPLLSRFTGGVHRLEPNQGDYSKWALGSGLDPIGVSFTSFFPGCIEVDDNQTEAGMKPGVSPRTFTAMLRAWMSKSYPAEVEYEYLSGICSEDVAQGFLGYVKVAASLPDPDYCIKNPDTYKVPPVDQPDVRIALAAALASRATEVNSKNYFKAIDRLPKDMQNMSIIQAIHRNKQLVAADGFSEWAFKNNDIIFA